MDVIQFTLHSTPAGRQKFWFDPLYQIDLAAYIFIMAALLTKGIRSDLSHVTQSDGSLAGAVHEQIAFLRVELRGCDDLGELLHVSWLDVHDVE